MNTRSPTQTKTTPPPSFTPVRTGILQRKCDSCGQHTIAGGKCTECQKKGLPLERRSTNQAEPFEVPSIVHEVLRAPGQPLNQATRAFMESRFSHDFSQVRVHTGTQAAESAQAMNSLAYTVGHNIVFGAGQYVPGTTEGKRLLGHELTHVVQQQNVNPHLQKLSVSKSFPSSYELEADEVGHRIASGQSASVSHKMDSAMLQKQSLVEEPAGGCGMCYGPKNAGRAAHTFIQEEFEINYPLGLTEFPFSSPTDDNGRLDLAIAMPTGFEIGEIKPAHAAGYAEGASDMTFYYTALRAAYPNSSVRPLERVLPPEVTIFPNPQVPSCPQQTLYVNPPVDGVYGYYCRPSYSELVRNPECRCDQRRQPVPVPVPAPAPQPERNRQPSPNSVPTAHPVPAQRSAIEEIADFIRQVVQSGEDAEAAARRFLADHPEVRYLLIGAAVTVIIATLAEDIASFGAGILDDPASISVALVLIRVAQTGR